MKTYWNYSEKERSELTEENIKAMLDVELMTKGVLKPSPPKLVEIAANPLGPRKVYFGIESKSKYGSSEHIGVCFATAEQALKFAELQPLIRDYDYEVGHEYTYVKPLSDTAVKTEELYDINQINEFRSTMKNRKAASDQNEKAKSEFNAACKKSEEITDGVWKDWYQQREEASELRRIISTYNEYVTLTQDVGLALTFLEKAYPAERIATAREWFPGEIPCPSLMAVSAVANA